MADRHKEIRELDKKIDVVKRLDSFRQIIEETGRFDATRGTIFLIQYDPDRGEVNVKTVPRFATEGLAVRRSVHSGKRGNLRTRILQGRAGHRPVRRGSLLRLRRCVLGNPERCHRARAQAYREAGWSEVIVLEPGSYFHTWEHERRTKKQGGKVYIAVSHRGDVTCHEGYVSPREARRQDQSDARENPERPELTAPLQNYVDLHRHAVVRARVAAKPMLALRLVLAHAIVGSGLWNVRVEPQRALTDAIAESVETCASEAVFDVQRRAVLAALGFDADAPTVTGGFDGDCGISGLFVRLLALTDEAVLDALATVMAETLECGTPLVETLGRHLQIDMPDAHAIDGVLLDLIKDREVLDAIVAEVAGPQATDANAKATGKVKRQIIADCLAGTNGRTKVERFVPRWMAFPPNAYTQRGGVATVSRAAAVGGLFAPLADNEAETEPQSDAEPPHTLEQVAEAA